MSGNVSKPSKSTVLGLCRALVEDFPEYNSRVIAVSEADVQEDNIPSEPLIMVSCVNVLFSGGDVKTNQEVEVTENLVIEFWDKTEQVKNRNKQDTPFWAFYDYDDILERMAVFGNEFRSPRKNRIKLQRMDIDSSKAALVLAFTAQHVFVACRDRDEGTIMKIVGKACLDTSPRPCKEEDNAKNQC